MNKKKRKVDQTGNKNLAFIWWLNSIDLSMMLSSNCDKSTSFSKTLNLPDYLYEQLNDLLGRAGRGRLWIAKEIKELYKQEEPKVDSWIDGPIGDNLSRTHGGIVVKMDDLQLVQKCPGLITDFQLTPLWEWSKE